MRKALSVLLLIAVGGIAAVPACADSVLYDNTGPSSSHFAAFAVSFGSAVTDSFTLAKNSTLTGVNLVTWLVPGDTLSSLDWSITSSFFGGTTEASGTASPSNSLTAYSPYGYSLYMDSFVLPNLGLAAGTYWLQIGNAVDAEGNSVFWDASDGPSAAYANAGVGALSDFWGPGTTGSETFQILGAPDTPDPTVTPEPSGMLLLGTGLAGLAILVRRKLKA